MLEPSHALARAIDKAAEMDRDQILLLNMCGRGDKDIFSVMDYLGASAAFHNQLSRLVAKG